MRQVVITGMGAITPLGTDARSTWMAMMSGHCAIAPLVRFASDDPRARIAAEVCGFDPTAHFNDKQLPLLDRVSQFALVAAREAVIQSGLKSSGGLGDRTAVIVGTGAGGQHSQDDQFRRLYGERNPRVHPLTIVRLMANAPASHLSIEFGIRGPAFAVSSACASANHALTLAMRMVRDGEVDIALAGGSEACLTYGGLKSWEAMRVLADDTCRPFSAQRRGLVLGEGAGIFVLEAEDHARQRGAPILAEFCGAGMSADATDLVFPSVDGAARAMAAALTDAGLALDEVDYINAHGTGTLANDTTETAAIRQVFGARANRLAVSSTKSMHGHAMGAAGAIELVSLIGALQDGVIPPTVNFVDPDPSCDLDYVPNIARKRSIQAGLSNSFAFGGLNAVVALKRAAS